MLPLLRKAQVLYGWTLVALTDLAVTIPWVLLLYRGSTVGEWHTSVPGVWLSLLVYAAAGLWASAEGEQRERGRTARIVAALVGVGGAYLLAYLQLPVSMKTGLLAPNLAFAYMPVAAYLWYQGTLAVMEGLDYGRLSARLPYQVVGTAVGIFLLMKFGGAAEPGTRLLLYWSVALFLAGGILSLIVAREQQLRAGQASLGEKGSGAERQSRTLSWVVLGLLLLTFAVSYLTGAGGLEALASGFRSGVAGFARLLGSLLYLILYRWAQLFEPLFKFIEWAFMMALRKQKPLDPIEMEDGGDDFVADDSPPLLDLNRIMPYLQVAVIIALVVVVLIAIARISRKRKRLARDEEEIVSLGFWQNLLADLKSLFADGTVAVKAALQPAESLDPRSPRMLFRRLQSWGETLGRPRRTDETPNAYGSVLGGSRPGGAGQIDQVTAVYNRARYGAAAPSEAEVAAAAEAMARLETAPPKE